MIDPNHLEALHKAATPGPWEIQDGCSWRRLGNRDGDGNVLCPSTYSAKDNHPDLIATGGQDLYANLRLIVALHTAAPELIAALRERDDLRARVAELEKALCEIGRKSDEPTTVELIAFEALEPRHD